MARPLDSQSLRTDRTRSAASQKFRDVPAEDQHLVAARRSALLDPGAAVPGLPFHPPCGRQAQLQRDLQDARSGAHSRRALGQTSVDSREGNRKHQESPRQPAARHAARLCPRGAAGPHQPRPSEGRRRHASENQAGERPLCRFRRPASAQRRGRDRLHAHRSRLSTEGKRKLLMDELEQTGGAERYWAIWQRRKWLAISSFAALFALLVGIAVFLPDMYTSTATVLVDQDQLGSLVRPAGANEMDVRQQTIEMRLQTINQQILSRARLQEVIERLNLYPNDRARVPIEDLAERMRRDIRLELKNIEQEPGKRSTIAFNVSYRAR